MLLLGYRTRPDVGLGEIFTSFAGAATDGPPLPIPEILLILVLAVKGFD